MFKKVGFPSKECIPCGSRVDNLTWPGLHPNPQARPILHGNEGKAQWCSRLQVHQVAYVFLFWCPPNKYLYLHLKNKSYVSGLVPHADGTREGRDGYIVNYILLKVPFAVDGYTFCAIRVIPESWRVILVVFWLASCFNLDQPPKAKGTIVFSLSLPEGSSNYARKTNWRRLLQCPFSSLTSC